MTRRIAGHAALALLALVAGCGLQAKKERTALIVRAADATLALRPHDAVLTSTMRPHDVNGRRLTKLRIDGKSVELPTLALPAAAVALDLRARRAVIVPSPVCACEAAANIVGGMPPSAKEAGPPGLGTSVSLMQAGLRRMPLAVGFSRWDIFVRPNAGELAQGAGVQAGGGAWLWLDVGALDPDRKTSLAAPTALPLLAPHVLVMLLKGALTGSVRQIGIEEVGGTSTTRLRFNIDRGKAADDLNDSEAQRLDRLFDAANVDGTFFDGAEAWIDRDGVARRLSVTVEQRIDTASSFDLTYLLEIGAARSQPLPLPSNDDLAEVPTLPELLPGAGA